jgi:myo-inositol-hexaphosphate 3-phosphohydrolase
MRFSGWRLFCSSNGALSGQKIKLFAIVCLKGGIVVDTETSVLPSAAEAIAAAKLRAHDVARRHPGQEPDTFRLMDATGKILGLFPKKSPMTKSA